MEHSYITDTNYVKRVHVSNDKLSRTVIVADGIYSLTRRLDDESIYSGYIWEGVFYGHGKPYYTGHKSLKEAYNMVKSGNPGIFRGNQWVNK